MQIILKTEANTKKFAKALASVLKGGETVALVGELGAGKTTFTKYLLAAAGVRSTVTSPTFVLMVPYKGKRLTFYHLDLYRTGSFSEVEALGISDIWNSKQNVAVIEWADKILPHLPGTAIVITFSITGNGRTAEIKNAPKALAKYYA